MKHQDWKERLGIVYSTNPDYAYEQPTADEAETLPKERQRLRVRMERAGRKGKTVTVVTGFVGTTEDLKAFAKQLKTYLGIGGTAKDGEVIVQGDVRERVVAWLMREGYVDVK